MNDNLTGNSFNSDINVDDEKKTSKEIIKKLIDYNEIIIQDEENSCKFLFPDTVKKITDNLEYHNKNIKTNICNMCKSEKKDILKSYCGHELCDKCFYKLRLIKCTEFKNKCHNEYDNVYHRICPYCEQQFIHRIISDKYVVICLGTTTNLYKFYNGGYIDVIFCYFPDNMTDTFRYVTYEKNKLIKEKIYELIKNNYIFVFQDSIKVEKWLKEICIKDLFSTIDNKILKL